MPAELSLAVDLFDLTLGVKSPVRTKSGFINRIVDSVLLQMLAEKPDLAVHIARLVGPKHDQKSVDALKAKLQTWGYPEVASALDGFVEEAEADDPLLTYQNPEDLYRPDERGPRR